MLNKIMVVVGTILGSMAMEPLTAAEVIPAGVTPPVPTSGDKNPSSNEVKNEAPVLVEVKDKAFSIELPFDWLRDKPREGIDLFAYAPVRATDQVALTNIGIVAGKVNKNLTLASFYKANIENLPIALENYEEISSGTGGISGVSANWIIFKRTLKTDSGEIPLEELQYYLISGEYGYVITFSATPNEFVYNRGVFEKIVQSFKILQTGVPSLDLINIFPGR